MRHLPQADVPLLPFVWTRDIAARETLRYLDRKGIDAEPLLSKSELSRVQLTQDPGKLSAASQHRFLELAAVEADDPLLGLHAAAAMDLREIGLLFYLAASSATVAERSSTWRNTPQRQPRKFALRSRSSKMNLC